MARLVRRPQAPDLNLQNAGLKGVFQSDIAGMQGARAVTGDNYLERMVKYIPAEVIGFSMLINAILEQAAQSGGKDAAMAGFPVSVIATGALLVACILTPVYSWYVREDGDAWIVNAVVSTVAFPFWAYLMGAVAFANVHDGNLAVILILSFTVVSGLVSPLPRKSKVAVSQEAARPMEAPMTAPMDGPRLVEAFA